MQRTRRLGQAGETVVFDELMAVGRKDEGHVEPFTLRVGFGLIETMAGRQAFLLGLDQRHRHRLGRDGDLEPQGVALLMSSRTYCIISQFLADPVFFNV